MRGRTRTALLAAVVLIPAVATPAAGQAPGHSLSSWKQVETDHFLFLFPEELAEWTLAMARRMESVHEAVESFVGFAPESRVTVLVDDPGNVSSGSMNPGPLLYLYPTPPNPRSMIAENRGWGEILAVHEFAHAAHLTRPSRNPRERLLWSLLPIPVQPITRRTPRWAVEGYATYVEGRLTGSGRPHGVWRPAVLRTWALDGQLPTYGGLNGGRGFYAGSMAYLAGSAYLEWLVDREDRGEEVLPDVWRRLTARQRRSFGSAFAGVFGASPAELYGHFTVDVTERALAMRDAVEAAGGPVEGELFQRLGWSTGDPAISPDGERLAVVLRARQAPSRLVVISTTPDTATMRELERRRAVFEADPEDVEPVQRWPRTQRPQATLWPTLGREYRSPRWLPDGSGLLVIRSDVVENSRNRPDLFLWGWESGDVRRITRGAAIREADPSPDGSWAAGVRCLHGRCDIVRIQIATGEVTTLAGGDPLRPYYHPRISPDGRTIVASVQDSSTWRLVAMDADGSDIRPVGPDDGASRFGAEFLRGGDTLVVTSTRGGIHDIERVALATGAARPLTRVLTAAAAPAPSPAGEVFFLALHSRGWDLRRIGLGEAAPTAVAMDPSLTPAAAVGPEAAPSFEETTVGPVRPYGLGPRFRTLLPIGVASVEGGSAGAALGGTDPIGRLSWQLQGLYGEPETWRGGALRVLWRGTRPWVHLEGFWTRHAPEVPVPADPLGLVTGYVDRASELEYLGGAASLELRRIRLGRTQRLRVGGSAGRVTGDWIGGTLDNEARAFGYATYGLGLRQMPGEWRLTQSLSAHAAFGRTGDLAWTRWRVAGSLALATPDRGVTVAGLLGDTDAPAGSVESFAVGGVEPPLFDPTLMSQRVGMPALPVGRLRGDRVGVVDVELRGVLPATPFYWAGSVDGDELGWYHVAGLRLDTDQAAIPYIRLPRARARLGVARTFSRPDEGEWRMWALLTFRP